MVAALRRWLAYTVTTIHRFDCMYKILIETSKVLMLSDAPALQDVVGLFTRGISSPLPNFEFVRINY